MRTISVLLFCVTEVMKIFRAKILCDEGRQVHSSALESALMDHISQIPALLSILYILSITASRAIGDGDTPIHNTYRTTESI